MSVTPMSGDGVEPAPIAKHWNVGDPIVDIEWSAKATRNWQFVPEARRFALSILAACDQVEHEAKA